MVRTVNVERPAINAGLSTFYEIHCSNYQANGFLMVIV